MGNKSSLLLREEEITEIQQETGFSPNQIERLYSRFTTLDKNDDGTLSRNDFLRIPELAINPLGDRIVHAFFGDSDEINFRQFTRVLARFRPIKKGRVNDKLNTREEKLRCTACRKYSLQSPLVIHLHIRDNIFNKTEYSAACQFATSLIAFRMYDLDDDSRISKDELLAVLHMMVGANISDDQLSSIADRTIKEADADHDNMISFDEFCEALSRTDVEQKMSIRFLN